MSKKTKARRKSRSARQQQALPATIRARMLEKAMRRVVTLQNRRRQLDKQLAALTESIRTARLELRSLLADETEELRDSGGALPEAAS